MSAPAIPRAREKGDIPLFQGKGRRKGECPTFRPPAAHRLRTCPACSSALVPHARVPTRDIDEVFFSAALRARLTTLDYARCRRCRSVWATDARRDEMLLSQLYATLPPDYWAPLDYGPAFHAAIETVLNRHAPGRVLYDVGCGDGKFLTSLSARWQKHGLEPGRAAVAQCRATGLAVDAATPAAVAQDAVCDAMTCLDVIEHVSDPRIEIDAMARMLRPGGVLVILTGDPLCWTARLAGPVWEYLHCVGHVSILSRSALRKLLTQAGMRVVQRATVNHPASLPLVKWLPSVLRSRWQLRRAGRYERLRYCRDHQLVVARKPN